MLKEVISILFQILSSLFFEPNRSPGESLVSKSTYKMEETKLRTTAGKTFPTDNVQR